MGAVMGKHDVRIETVARMAGNVAGAILERHLTDQERKLSDVTEQDVEFVAWLSAELASRIVTRVQEARVAAERPAETSEAAEAGA
jgi:hypothetical protein